MEKVVFHAIDADEAVRVLNSDAARGLTDAEVTVRAEKFGPNELPAGKSKTVFERLWAQINSVLIYVLLAGACLSFGFNHYADGFVILGVIVVNIFLGYIMEERAENSSNQLKGLMSPTAMVLRDKEKSQIQAKNLTIGDIFFLQAGDIVPADARVLTSADLNVLEAALTGEAHAIFKFNEKLSSAEAPLAERTCMVFAGTQVIKGTATCLVTNIGSKCEIGKINALLQQVEDLKTPLVLELENFGVFLSITILFVAIVALIAAIARSYSVQDAFSFAIGIAVAAIPEGLPSCVTITFSIGVYYMSKHNAIVKTLPAVETLGSVSVICSDKTGTLTINKMTVKAIVTQTLQYHVSATCIKLFNSNLLCQLLCSFLIQEKLYQVYLLLINQLLIRSLIH
jgi:P-type E1-E2 ATPase